MTIILHDEIRQVVCTAFGLANSDQNLPADFLNFLLKKDSALLGVIEEVLSQFRSLTAVHTSYLISEYVEPDSLFYQQLISSEDEKKFTLLQYASMRTLRAILETIQAILPAYRDVSLSDNFERIADQITAQFSMDNPLKHCRYPKAIRLIHDRISNAEIACGASFTNEGSGAHLSDWINNLDIYSPFELLEQLKKQLLSDETFLAKIESYSDVFDLFEQSLLTHFLKEQDIDAFQSQVMSKITPLNEKSPNQNATFWGGVLNVSIDTPEKGQESGMGTRFTR